MKHLLLIGSLLWATAAVAAPPPGVGWSSVRQAPATIWYRPAAAGAARHIASITDAAVQRVQVNTGVPLPPHVDVVLAADADAFARAQPSAPPSWAAGTAWAERGEIYLRTGMAGSIDQVYVHELVHIALGRAFPDHPPRWLNEGVAKLVAGEVSPADHAVLARAAITGNLLPVARFADSWPSGAGAARLAYVQSIDFTAYLARQGDAVLPDLIGRLAAGAELPEAVQASTGRSLADLEESWRGRLGFWHALVPLVGSTGFVWGGTSVLFVFAGWRRRRRIRRQLKDMEERERLAAQPAPDPWPAEDFGLPPAPPEGGAVPW